MTEPGAEIRISISNQRLDLYADNELWQSYPVSTAKNGAGELWNSECTPRGLHSIRLKIGENCPVNSVFIGRRPSGEIYTSELAKSDPERDWVLTRIIWLSGTEPGFNRGGQCDSLRRYIYIHGTPDKEPMGTPLSHGCIRMRNNDIKDLFDACYSGMSVIISE